MIPKTEKEVIDHLNSGKIVKLCTSDTYYKLINGILYCGINHHTFKTKSSYISVEEFIIDTVLKNIILVDSIKKEEPNMNTGLSTNYYKLEISDPANLKKPYICECQDIIEALGMTFNEGEDFKALWRRAARRTLGLTKEGTSNLYDAEKIKYFGDRIHKEELREQLKEIKNRKIIDSSVESAADKALKLLGPNAKL